MASKVKGINEILEEDANNLIDSDDDEDEDIECHFDPQQFLNMNADQDDRYQIEQQQNQGINNVELTEIPEDLEESQASKQLFDKDLEVPILMIDDNSQISQGGSIKLTGFQNYIKQKENERNLIEKQFEQIVQQKAQELINEQKKDQMMKKIQKEAIPSKLQLKIQSLMSSPQILDSEINLIKQSQNPKRQQTKTILNDQQQKLQDEIQRLKDQLQEYQVRFNQDQEIIKNLKILIQKNDVNVSRTSCSTKASKTDEYKEETEKLRQEIISLKLQHQKELEQQKAQFSRTQKIQSGLQKHKEKEQIVIDKEKQEIEKLKAELASQGSDFRNKINELSQINQKNNEQIAELKKQLFNLQKSQDKPDQQKLIIQNLKEQNQKLLSEIENVKQRYMFDNQIKLLFPTYQEYILKILNIFYSLEQNKKAIKNIKQKLISYVYPVFQAILKGYEWLKQQILYKITRNPIQHPDNQALLKAAIQKIRVNPTVLENENNKYIHQISLLEKENQEITYKFEQLKKEIAEKEQRYGQLDELVRIDKIQLANQFMMRILKKEAEDKQSNDEELNSDVPSEVEIIKKYVELIYQSTQVTQLSGQSKTKAKSPIKEKSQTLTNKQKNQQNQVTVTVTQCGKTGRHQKRDQVQTKGMYYQK